MENKATEAQIQNYCLSRLQMLELQQPIYYFRSNSFSGSITRYDGSRGFIKSAKRGLPDIVLLVNGAFVGLELKTEKGRQSDVQKQAQEQIEKAGGKYFICRSPESFETIIKELLKRSPLN